MIKKAISYVLIFLGIQLLSGGLMTIMWRLVDGSGDQTALQIIVTSAVSSIVTIIVFLGLRWTEASPTWLRTRPWTVLAWSVVAALGAIIPSVWLQEQMPELPNWAEDTFDMLLSERWGYVVIGLLAPLSEEIVMRGGVLRALLGSERLSPWVAIAISALFFAFIHLNPVQMPHAFLVGLLLGWMYWRTGSILPGVAYHWANNSVAYVLYNLYPSLDNRLVDVFGSQQRVLMAVAFSLLILIPAVYQLHLWMKRADER